MTALDLPPVLGPFAPPADYEFEPELRGEVPRQIPAELRHGRHALRQRRMVSGFTFARMICIAASALPVVQLWGLFVLPLQYLAWVGAGCVVIAVVSWISDRLQSGPYRYVREAVPVAARVRELLLRPSAIVNGQVSQYHFAAVVEYRARVGPLQTDQWGAP
jgi:hypothetical protein